MSFNESTHIFHLNAEPFELISSGKKTVELRLFDKKREKISVGDILVFENRDDPSCRLFARVTDILRKDTFAELFDTSDSELFGFGAGADYREMYRYYSPEDEKRYGVLGIKFELIKGESKC